MVIIYIWRGGVAGGICLDPFNTIFQQLANSRARFIGSVNQQDQTFDAELGVIGLALLAVVLGAPLIGAVRARRRRLVPIAFGAYVAFLAHAAVEPVERSVQPPGGGAALRGGVAAVLPHPAHVLADELAQELGCVGE